MNTAVNDALLLLRRIMTRIHEQGNIFYDRGRLEAYKLLAVTASNLRREHGR